MIKRNMTQETFFRYKKPQILQKNVFRKHQKKNHGKFSRFSVSRIGPKKRKVASYRRNNKLGVSFKMGYDESKLSFFELLCVFIVHLLFLSLNSI